MAASPVHIPQDGAVGLISAPWPLFSRPSIQLGALKAYLRKDRPDLAVDTHHLYLALADAIGHAEYAWISERPWTAEAVYAALAYPDMYPSARKLFERTDGSTTRPDGLDFKRIVRSAARATDDALAAVEWGRYLLIGVSVCLCQLTASLYVIDHIRRRWPRVPMVVGGSSFGVDSAAGLLDACPDIDAVVCGEGEQPLAAVVAAAEGGASVGSLAGIPGVVTRQDRGGPPAAALSQLPDIAALPAPDFDDYFRQLKTLPADRRFFPVLPLEASRGCWWQRHHRSGRKGCAFCNLNRQWRGYRTKDPCQVVREIDALTARYRVLGVAFMDNVLPPGITGRRVTDITALGKDLDLFGEIRANIPAPSLAAMARAGFATVQIGIEALSSGLLKKLNKGTSAIDNLYVMKCCEQFGIVNNANLIIWFPGSDGKDVAQTLTALSCAQVFRPLKCVRFWLGVGSPVYDDPAAFGIQSVFNHPDYRRLLPEAMVNRVRLPVQAYRGDRRQQRRLWRPVERAVSRWRADYRELHADPMAGPILGFFDGGDFMIIRQRRIADLPMNHRLTGTSRAIYRFCHRPRYLDAVTRRFPSFSEAQIRSFLQMMVEKRLMFADEDRFLSLAVPIRRR